MGAIHEKAEKKGKDQQNVEDPKRMVATRCVVNNKPK
jgi:hypothetical protein